jgi:hypothetical protein
MVYRDPVNLATITLTLDLDGGKNGQGQGQGQGQAVAVAKGMVCSFPDLLEASQEDGRRNPSFARRGLGLDFEAFLDHHVPGRDTFQYPLAFGAIVLEYEKVQVLHPGHLRGLPKKPPSKEFHRRHVGLLLYMYSRTGREGAKGQESVVAFERLGVCIWSDRSSNDLLEEKIEWRGVEQMVLQ